jgi:hypothetical protein
MDSVLRSADRRRHCGCGLRVRRLNSVSGTAVFLALTSLLGLTSCGSNTKITPAKTSATTKKTQLEISRDRPQPVQTKLNIIVEKP